MDVKLEASWKQVLQEEFDKPYFAAIVQQLKEEKKAGKIIFPPGPFIFNAFQQTPFEQVRVVILGQDPYHNPHQAHGLSFSVPEGIKPPPSLMNMYKEIEQSTGNKPHSTNGNLTHWAQQGVLLLNAILTVRANEPASHAKIGWMQFTDAVIQKIASMHQDVIFLLWGRFAQEKSALIDDSRHQILKAAHPSPFSADKGFFGCGHFRRVNELLIARNQPPINW